MCTAIIVKSGPERSRIIESQADLVALVGVEAIRFRQPAPSGAEGFDSCLCWVDVRAVGEAAGYHVSRDDTGDFIFQPHPTKETEP